MFISKYLPWFIVVERQAASKQIFLKCLVPAPPTPDNIMAQFGSDGQYENDARFQIFDFLDRNCLMRIFIGSVFD